MTVSRAPALVSVLIAATTALATSTATAETLVVVKKRADAIDVVEPGSGRKLMTVVVGHVPHEIAISPDGKRALVTNYGTAQDPGRTLSVLDLEQPRVVAAIDLGRHTRPHGVAWYAPDRAAVTTEGSGQLLIVDPVARRIVAGIATDQAVSHMVAISPDRSRAFVTNIDSGSTTVIDLPEMKKLRDLDTGAGSEGLAVTPDGAFAWVAARAAGSIAIVDARTLEVMHRFDVPGVPIRIAFTPDGRTALVSCAGAGEVVAVDVASRNIVARRRLDLPLSALAKSSPAAAFAASSPGPVGLAVDDSKAYVAATMADTVVELSVPSLEVRRTIGVAGEPDGLGLTPLLPKFECHACEKPPD